MVKSAQQLHEAVVLAWCWSAITALGFTLIFSLWGSHIIELLTSIDEVRTTAQTYLIWLVLLPLWSFSSYLFDGVYIGAAKGKVMRNSMILATLGRFSQHGIYCRRYYYPSKPIMPSGPP